jgi:hypothetical protein
MIQETRLEVPRTGVGAVGREIMVDNRPTTFKRTSWGAIIAGVVAAMAVQTLLMLLGAAIGLTVAATTGPGNPNDTGMGVGAGIWLLIASIISLFVGGWVAGAMSGARNDFDSTLHGFVMWGTTTALSAILLTTAGMAALGGAMGAASNVAGGLAQNPSVTNSVRNPSSGASNSNGSNPDAFVRAQLNATPNMRNVNDETIRMIVPAVESGSSASQSQNAIDALASAGNMSRSEAQQTIDRWRQEYQSNQSSGSNSQIGSSGSNSSSSSNSVDRTQVQKAADRAAKTAAGASWWTFFALLLGACAACLGGYTGTRRVDFDYDLRG